MITFNADEVFEMAEEIERNGAKFYRIAAEAVEGDNKDMLLGLAEMEDDHEKMFADMRAELTQEQRQPLAFDPDDENALYLRAMADGEVFAADPSGMLTGDESMEEVLKTAIGLEKDSIIFYQCMKDMVPKVAGKERIDGIIRQEIGHVHDLFQQLKQLQQ